MRGKLKKRVLGSAQMNEIGKVEIETASETHIGHAVSVPGQSKVESRASQGVS